MQQMWESGNKLLKSSIWITEGRIRDRKLSCNIILKQISFYISPEKLLFSSIVAPGLIEHCLETVLCFNVFQILVTNQITTRYGSHNSDSGATSKENLDALFGMSKQMI